MRRPLLLATVLMNIQDYGLSKFYTRVRSHSLHARAVYSELAARSFTFLV